MNRSIRDRNFNGIYFPCLYDLFEKLYPSEINLPFPFNLSITNVRNSEVPSGNVKKKKREKVKTKRKEKKIHLPLLRATYRCQTNIEENSDSKRAMLEIKRHIEDRKIVNV